MATSHLTVSAEERTRSARKRLGQVVLGKWRLDHLLGIGGMAAVFEATHRNGNRVAIKILHPDLAGFDEIRERFLAEGYAANRVSHPGVVPVRDEGTTEDGAVFLVMDLLRGQTLAERLDSGQNPFSVREVLEISSQLLDVLVHAHDRGIVHRDIKPENVFLAADGRVRLLDFGIARVETHSRTHATQAGTTLGTPAFMPPEQALGHWQDLDGRSDLWALGASMFLLLSGLPVREHGSVTEQLLGAMTRPVQSLGEVTALPRSVVAVVDRALAFDREARFPDARSMQLAVRAVQAELSEPDSRATLPPPPSLEPMALSLRTPYPEGRERRPSVPTMRPLSATLPPAPASSAKPARSALAAYVTLGFSVGIGIVVAARLTLQPAPPSSLSAQPEPTESILPIRPRPGVAPEAAATSVAPTPSPAASTPSPAAAAPSSSAAPLASASGGHPPASKRPPAAARAGLRGK
jgi:serine/threonine-protein kinase